MLLIRMTHFKLSFFLVPNFKNKQEIKQKKSKKNIWKLDKDETEEVGSVLDLPDQWSVTTLINRRQGLQVLDWIQ